MSSIPWCGERFCHVHSSQQRNKKGALLRLLICKQTDFCSRLRQLTVFMVRVGFLYYVRVMFLEHIALGMLEMSYSLDCFGVAWRVLSAFWGLQHLGNAFPGYWQSATLTFFCWGACLYALAGLCAFPIAHFCYTFVQLPSETLDGVLLHHAVCSCLNAFVKVFSWPGHLARAGL